jgi:hypothetical protein
MQWCLPITIFHHLSSLDLMHNKHFTTQGENFLHLFLNSGSIMLLHHAVWDADSLKDMSVIALSAAPCRSASSELSRGLLYHPI